MNGSTRFILVSAAALVMSCGSAPRTAHGAEPTPEIDVVAQTAVRLSPAHTQMVRQKLVEYARGCFGGLVPEGAPVPAGAAKDGAARFRLFIEHAATLKTAGHADKDTQLTDKDYYALFLLTHEKGVYKFRLAEWKDARYVNVDQWTGPYAVVHRLSLPEHFTSRDMPALRAKALKYAYPRNVKQALLSHLIPIRIGQSRGVPGKEQSCQVIVKNASPWTLQSLQATLRWPDPRTKALVRYEGAVTVSAALPPGQQTAVPCLGKPLTLDFRWQYLEPVEIEASPVFAPAKP